MAAGLVRVPEANSRSPRKIRGLRWKVGGWVQTKPVEFLPEHSRVVIDSPAGDSCSLEGE